MRYIRCVCFGALSSSTRGTLPSEQLYCFRIKRPVCAISREERACFLHIFALLLCDLVVCTASETSRSAEDI